jgi:hypothetical protein
MIAAVIAASAAEPAFKQPGREECKLGFSESITEESGNIWIC